MAKKKSSKSSGGVKIRVGRRKIKAPWWVFIILLVVAALAVAGYFVYTSFHSSSRSSSSEPASSTTSSSSQPVSSSSTPLPSGVAPIDIYLQELGNGSTGDSIYVKAGDNDILIDAGSDSTSAKTLTAFLKEKVSDNKLEYVIATHAHTDHIGAFYGNDGIFANFNCRTIIDFPKYGSDKDPSKTTTVFGKYCAARDAEVSGGSSFGAEHYTALACYNANSTGTTGAHRYYTLGENLTMEILYNYYYDHNQSAGENDYSVCLQFIQGENRYLFCGDCEELSEKKLLTSNPDSIKPSVFYKADHHGSKTSSCPEFMAAVHPKFVGVSCVAGNYEYKQTHFDYTFPCQRTINTLGPITKAIMVTTLGSVNDLTSHTSFNGTIHVAGRGTTQNDVTMEGSVNSTYLKDSAWFKTVGNQEGGTVDEGDGVSVNHATNDPNRYWPEGGVD